MAGKIRLFEKLEDGRLAEVPADRADQAREGRPVSRVMIPIDVLWTDEEIAERDARREAELGARADERKASHDREQRRAAIAGRLGLTMDELGELLK